MPLSLKRCFRSLIPGKPCSRSSRWPAEKEDGARIDVDIVTHLIALFQASQREKQERLASIEAEVSQAKVWLWNYAPLIQDQQPT